MSKMKGMLRSYAIMLAMAAMGNTGYSKMDKYTELTEEEEKERLKAIAEKRRIERLKRKGVREFYYGQNVIYARNQKNADRKARNKGYL